MKYSVEQIMYGSFIKYDRMKDMVAESFGRDPLCASSQYVSVYIDMNSLIKPLYLSDSIIEDYTVITSCIINLCGHIREFFRKINVYAYIYIIYSLNDSKSARMFCADYNRINNETYNMKFIHTVITPNIELLKLLCAYLPDIVFVDATNMVDASTIIYHLMKMNSKNPTPSIIYTKDPMSFQPIAHFNGAVVFRPKKNIKDGDISIAIARGGLVQGYRYVTGRAAAPSELDDGLLSLVMAISGVKSRSISTHKTIAQAEKLIKDFIECNILVNGYNSIDTVTQFCQAINGHEYAQIFKAIDVIYQDSLLIDDTSIVQAFARLYDPDAVKEINNNYFKKYPLDLNRL